MGSGSLIKVHLFLPVHLLLGEDTDFALSRGHCGKAACGQQTAPLIRHQVLNSAGVLIVASQPLEISFCLTSLWYFAIAVPMDRECSRFTGYEQTLLLERPV